MADSLALMKSYSATTFHSSIIIILLCGFKEKEKKKRITCTCVIRSHNNLSIRTEFPSQDPLIFWGIPQLLPYIFLIASQLWLKLQTDPSGPLFMILTSLFINILSVGQLMRSPLMLFSLVLQTPAQELWLSPVRFPTRATG